jgi:hypothetical protein
VDRRLIVIGLALAVFGVSRTSLAAPKDAAALKIEKDAIYNDYLATKFADAEKKLKQALDLCKADACGAKVVAQLHRDLGIVYTVGIKKPADAKREFALAFKADPAVTLIKDLTTPEIEAAFEGARGTAPGPEPAGSRPAPAAAGGDIIHTAPTEQAVLTPVPIYAEMPEGVTASKAQVKYKPFGSTDWKVVEMKKLGDGWGAEIPCLDVGTTTGDLKYFIQAYDQTGDAAAMSGTRNAPHVVPIKNELSGEPPHLPDKAAPAQCPDPNACPPGLPGCKKERRVKKHGVKKKDDMCEDTSDCEEGLACKVGICVTDETYVAGGARACTTNEDCDPGMACNDGICGVPLQTAKQNWVSLAIQQDFLFLPSSGDTCSGQTDVTYQCFNTTGEWFDPAGLYLRPTTGGYNPPLVTGQGNQVSGGIGKATLRVLLGYDRLVMNNFLLGGRLGFAFGGGPQLPANDNSDPPQAAGKSFMPVHAEARGAYYFGAKPFMRKGFRPYALLALGLAQVDAAVGVNVYEVGQGNSPEKINAWRKTGNFFGAGGLGLQYAIDVGNAIFLEAKGQEQIGTPGTVVNVQLGYARGL